ncbi:MAG: hypothetical protein ACOYOJ_09340 [Alsobacter sp.]
MVHLTSGHPPFADELVAPRPRSTVLATLADAASPARILVALAISGMAALLLDPGVPRPATPPHPSGPLLRTEAPAWMPVSRPIPMFALDSVVFGREARRLEARRHATGGGREELHLLGTPGAAGGHARIMLYRPGSESPTPGTFYLDLARRAAEAGLPVARSAMPIPMMTKFGPAETADVVLGSGATAQACLAFRLIAEDTELRMSGWACGSGDRPLDRLWLACTLDRLDLLGSGEDRGLRAWFSRAERNRLTQCRGGRRAAWLDPDGPLAGLRPPT